MTREQLEHIKEEKETAEEIASEIMEGERDNYDGADGARTVLELCEDMNTLIQYAEDKIEESRDI